MYQGGSDSFIGARDEVVAASEDWGIDFEAEVAVVTADVRMGAPADECAQRIRLLMLVNDVSLRNLIPNELAKGFGFFQSKPASSFSPVFVTPDALNPRWSDGKLKGVLEVDLNGQPFGRADSGDDMTFDFGTLVAHAAKTRKLGAGTIIGSGTVSNRDSDGGPGRPVADGGLGYSCIAEVRMVETIVGGKPQTPFLKPGDRVSITMRDERHHPIFGTIDQAVVAAG
jgi:fumarylacetoacetate (FAA) hydrolase